MTVTRGQVTRVLVVVAAALTVAAFLQVALAFDGSYYYFNILQEQRPFTPNGRYSVILLQWPLIAASHLTTNTAVLRDVFSLTYACPGVIALTLSWVVVRRDRPGLFLWPVLGICLLILPSSLFQVSEALIVAQLVWPVALATAVGLRSRAQMAIAAGVAVVMLGLHPLSSVLLGATGVLAAVTAWRNAERRRWLLGWALGLVAVGIARLLLVVGGQDGSTASSGLLDLRAADPTWMVVLALASAIVVGILAMAAKSGRCSGSAERSLLTTAALGVGVTAGLLLRWANTPSSWQYALDFREFPALLTLLLMSGMAVDAVSGAGTAGREPDTGAGFRGSLVQAVAACFAAVIIIEAISFHGLTSLLARQLRAAPTCVAPKDVGAPDSFIDTRTEDGHWWVRVLAIDLQEQQIAHVVLPAALCTQYRSDSSNLAVTVYDQHRSTTGWFSFPRLGP